jgi:folylpolyglutamate synthase/dihydropteroate synthase
MLHLAPLFDQVICTSSSSPRAFAPQEMLEATLPHNTNCQAVEGVGKAIVVAEGMAGKAGLIFVSGALYTIGEAMRHLGVSNGP